MTKLLNSKNSKHEKEMQLLDMAAKAYNEVEKTLSPEQVLLLDAAIDAAVEHAVICYSSNIVGQ